MNNYQLLYIIDNGVGDEEKQALVDKFSALIETLGGTVETVDKWGTLILSTTRKKATMCSLSFRRTLPHRQKSIVR